MPGTSPVGPLRSTVFCAVTYGAAVATDKRQRQKDARQSRREIERAAAARSRRARTIRNAILFALVVVAVALLLSVMR